MSELFGNPEQLPEPLTTLRHSISNGHRIAVYTAEQMRAYAIAARRAALEEAAQLLDTQHETRKHHDNHAAVYARMVRELADNPPPEACAGSAPR